MKLGWGGWVGQGGCHSMNTELALIESHLRPWNQNEIEKLTRIFFRAGSCPGEMLGAGLFAQNAPHAAGNVMRNVMEM